jgi:crotonobetainyl-CoA:carnitine CoA-transferase CaiB-like acyl-CoA transferase
MNGRFTNYEDFQAIMQPWLDEHTSAEIFERAQELRLPFALVPDMTDLLENEHLAYRGFFVAIPGDEPASDSRCAVPSPPLRSGFGPPWQRWSYAQGPMADLAGCDQGRVPTAPEGTRSVVSSTMVAPGHGTAVATS